MVQAVPSRRLVASLALALAALTACPPADAISRRRANRIALRALRADLAQGTVVVFGLPRPLGRKQRVDEAGPGAGAAARVQVAQDSTGTQILTPLSTEPIGRRAWLYWADFAPDGFFAHPGRILLVDHRRGRILRDVRVSWWPLVDGERPAFLQSAAAYNDPRYRIHASGGAIVRSAVRREAAPRAVDAGSCIVGIGDRTDPTTGPGFAAMKRLATTLGVSYRDALDARDLAAKIEDAYGEGCRKVTVYLVGHQSAIGSLIQGIPGPSVSLRSEHVPLPFTWKQQVLTAEELRGVLLPFEQARDPVQFTVIVEACDSGNFVPVLHPNRPGALGVAGTLVTSVGPNEVSFGPPKTWTGTEQPASPFLTALTDGVIGWLAGNAGDIAQAIVASWGDVKAKVREASVGRNNPQLECTGKIVSPRGAGDDVPESCRQAVEPPPGPRVLTLTVVNTDPTRMLVRTNGIYCGGTGPWFTNRAGPDTPAQDCEEGYVFDPDRNPFAVPLVSLVADIAPEPPPPPRPGVTWEQVTTEGTTTDCGGNAYSTICQVQMGRDGYPPDRAHPSDMTLTVRLVSRP